MFKSVQMRLLILLKKMQSVSRAASELSISQPAASSYLKTLEEETGCEVFFHGERPIKLTRAGEALCAQFEKILKLEEETLEVLSGIKNGRHPLWRVGTVSSFSSCVNPYYFPELLKSAERIQAKQGASLEIENLLKAGDIDFAVVNNSMAEAEGVISREIFTEESLVVVPAAMAGGAQGLAGLLPVLLKTPFVYSGAHSADNALVKQFLRTIGYQPEKAVEVDSYSTMCSLVSEGVCWSVLTPLGLWIGRDYAKKLKVLEPVRPARRRGFYFCRRGLDEKSEEFILRTICRALASGFIPALERSFPKLAGRVVMNEDFMRRYGSHQ